MYIQPTPEVGMGVTISAGSDRYPYTVTRIISPKRIEVQEDKAIRIDGNGMSETQEYRFEPNPSGEKRIITLRRNGAWIEMNSDRSPVHLGSRDRYYDYSF